MTYIITDHCILCGRCQSACPTGAIRQTAQGFKIQVDRCNDCVGVYSVAQCWSICPTNRACIQEAVPEGAFCSVTIRPETEYWQIWFITYSHRVAQLKLRQQSQYWTQWFDAYSNRLTTLLQTHSLVEVSA